MTAVSANGITIEYEIFGSADAPPLLLVMGLGGQMTLWPVELCEALVEQGFRVIRYDNRDIGLSTKFDDAGVPDIPTLMMQAMSGMTIDVPYQLDDMAADAIGLLDALDIPKAHVVGASMGGMIAQLLAADYPDRVISLTSVMSSTGNPALPPAQPQAMAVLTGRPATTEIDALVEFGVQAARAVGSPGFPAEEERLRTRVRADIERSFSPFGFARQMAAILANGDRREKLKTITAPTLVIHGEDDPLVPLEAGLDTAASIKDAEIQTIKGMGHDLPLELVDTIVGAIAKNTARAQESV